MTIRLAHDPILISHGAFIVRLRPSLRAGLLMAQKYSVEELAAKISELHLGAISHLVAIGCDEIDQAQALIGAVLAGNGVVGLADFHDELFAFIEISLGLSNDHDTGAKDARPSKSFDRADALTDLYEFATGWLQWSPADTWAATPAEIVHARKGHFAMLRAIHGSGDDEQDPRDLPTEPEIKTGLDRLRQLSGEVA
jgi:hypothetical protein